MDLPQPHVIGRAEALANLSEAHLPLEVDVYGPGDAWPAVGPALLAHASGTLRSILLLGSGDAHNDASRLLRSLYDHVVTFAWLAAEPSEERLGLWRLDDLAERLKADREAAAAGEPLLDDVNRQQMQREVDAGTGQLLDLASMAFATDRFWAQRLPVFGTDGLGTFRGMYTVLFRNHSGLVHATFRGLNLVTEHLSPTRRRVLVQPPVEGRGPYGLATAVYGIGLLVASESLGWPAADDVHAVFDRYPAR